MKFPSQIGQSFDGPTPISTIPSKNGGTEKDGVAVESNKTKLFIKLLVELVAFIAVFLHPAASQVVYHGTFYVAAFSPEYGVVAIDSREVYGQDIDDRQCKIRPLSQRAFFFSAGKGNIMQMPTRVIIWDPRQAAKEAYMRPGADNPPLASVSQEWANEVISAFSGIPMQRDSFAESILIDGFFVALDEQGAVTFSKEQVIYSPFGFQRFRSGLLPSIFIDPAKVPNYWNGSSEMVEEFRNGQETSRAKDVLAQLGSLSCGPDGVAARYTAIVTAVRNWTGDPSIGGEVACAFRSIVIANSVRS
jgi:hypothetical protein